MKLEFLGRVLVKVIKISLPWLFVILVIVLATWQLPNVKQPLGGAPKSDRENLLMPGLSVKQIAHLIELVAPNVNNSAQWADDLKNVLKIQHLEASHEDICAMIAIINQVSSFEENPRIAGLSEQDLHRLSEKLVAITPLGYRNASSVEAWLRHKPSIKNSYWHQLRAAKTQRAVDLIYRGIIADKLLLLAKPSSLRQIDLSLRDSIEANNAIKTIGPMQVAVSFAVQVEEQSSQHALSLDEIWAIRDRMYTREGGMGYGALLLLGYDGGYDKKLYRFADFNAGRYASRNAGFQATIAALLNKPLATDGDLLMYDKQGKPSATISNSERAINELAEKYHLALSAGQVRADLLQEKHRNFHSTVTYLTITHHYQKLMQKPAPFAIVPNIVLPTDKATRTMSTEKFTDKVNARYLQCINKQ